MKKIIKSIILILMFTIILMFVFNISYGMLVYGYFTKVSTAKDTVTFAKDNKVKYLNKSSYKIENKDYNNSAYYRSIKVKKNTPYRISCMIKTKNIQVLNEEDQNSGAKISLVDSEEESKSITGTNDWQKISLIFNSKSQEDIQIAFMLGGNSDIGSAKGVVWFTDFQVEEGALDLNNTWKFVCFLFKKVQVTIDGIDYKYEMSKEDIEQIEICMQRFKTTCEEFSDNLITVSYKIIEIEAPIASMSKDKENGYYIDSRDVSSLIASYIDNEHFDHIFACLRLSDYNSSIPINDWIGLGSMEYQGIGFSNIRVQDSNESNSFKDIENLNKFPEEVFIHEFLHSLERNSLIYGYKCPELHSYNKYGYKKDNILGLYTWYKDYMSCKIKFENENIGLDPEIYKYKTLDESNFENSIYLDYFNEPTRTIDKLKLMINTVNLKL